MLALTNSNQLADGRHFVCDQQFVTSENNNEHAGQMYGTCHYVTTSMFLITERLNPASQDVLQGLLRWMGVFLLLVNDVPCIELGATWPWVRKKNL